MADHVILVDSDDHEIGTAQKLAAHREGRLHRAFSIFIHSGDGRWLIQKRAHGKYHSGGLWSNACCSHPRPGEVINEAIHRRLAEELGIDCPLEKAFEAEYDFDVGGGLREVEYNHVYLGALDAATPLTPNESELSDHRWTVTGEILEDLVRAPEAYSAWFRLLFPRVVDHMAKRGS